MNGYNSVEACKDLLRVLYRLSDFCTGFMASDEDIQKTAKDRHKNCDEKPDHLFLEFSAKVMAPDMPQGPEVGENRDEGDKYVPPGKSHDEGPYE